MNKPKPIIKNRTDHYIFLLGLSLVTIAISPWWTSDGFNIPKLLFIVLVGFAIVPRVLNRELLSTRLMRKMDLILISLFPINLFIVLIFNDTNWIQQFYGEFGRRTGFITYISCFLIFLYSILISSNYFISKVVKVFVFLGILSATYGILQMFGLVEISALSSRNKIPYSVFGNIDFNSGFLGLTSIVIFGYILFNFNIKSKKFYVGLFLLIYIYEAIYLTKSQQGFVVSFTGVVTLILVYVYMKYGNGFRFKMMCFVSVFFATQFLLGLFDRGIAAKFLYESSVQARNYYWDAGIKMAIENPFLGVGLDRYGDWYWNFRSIEAINFLGPDDFSNSAHSIFIDILSSGGFPLLITYLILLILVFKSSIYVLRSKDKLQFEYVSLFACWIAFNVYSLFSIGQIGVLIWGWVFSGLLIGSKAELARIRTDKVTRIKNTPIINTIVLFVGFLIVLPVVKESSDIKTAIKLNDASSFLNYLDSFKHEPYNISLALNNINKLGMEAKSIKYINEALSKFPNNYDLWYLLYANRYSTNDQKQSALDNLNRLNFYNRILAEKKNS